MKTIQAVIIGVIAATLVLLTGSCDRSEHTFTSDWRYQPDRTWVGPEYWANRLQDWQISNGKLVCVNSNLGFRTVHLLTRRMGKEPGEATIRVTLGLHPRLSRTGSEGWAGILLGAGEDKLDYRGSALIHHSHGDAGGLIVAVNESGQVVFLDNTGEQENIGSMPEMPEASLPDSVILNMDIYPDPDSLYNIACNIIDPATREVITSNTLTAIEPHRLTGNIAVAAHHLDENHAGYTYWFRDLRVEGTQITEHPGHRFGPVMGIQFTQQRGTLKLTAQMAPVGKGDEPYVKFMLKDPDGPTWQQVDSAVIRPGSYTAQFTLENWDPSLDHTYRLVYKTHSHKGRKKIHYYTGTIPAEPTGEDEVVAGAFSCISHSDGSIHGSRFDYPGKLWFPHQEFVTSVKAQEPDILFFTGDQVYEGRPTPADFSSPEMTELDYLYKWYIFLWSVGDLTRSIPTVSIPDDHDVYHGNLWGDGGKRAPEYPEDSVYPAYYEGFEQHWQQDRGGYTLRPSSVNMIQETMTSHLPAPYHSEPVGAGINTYFTSLDYGRVSFAFLEDRKFKSPPSVVLPRARVVNGFAQNPYISGRNLDDPDARLLGEKQLQFIDEWTRDWKDVDMKASISQTIFVNLSTYPDTFKTDAGATRLPAPKAGVIPDGYRRARDMDSNGWPQSARNNALRRLRKGFVTLIGGDQHLGSLTHLGVDRWDDAGYSFCVPAIGNLWPRRWFPQEPGRDRNPELPAYTGKYFDGFGNRVTVWAVANPEKTGKTPSNLYDRAVGYGIIRFNKEQGTITFECWKRDGDPRNPEEGIYKGWPRTISMTENYGRTPRLWLPRFEVTGLEQRPVFQVIHEPTGEVVYTLRAPENTFQPGVFERGSYTVTVGNPDESVAETYSGIDARWSKPQRVIEVSF